MDILDIDFQNKELLTKFTYQDALTHQKEGELFNKLADCIAWAKTIEKDPQKVHIFAMYLWRALENFKRKVQ